MTEALHPVEFDQLTPAEKILYVQDLWDRIAACAEAPPIPDAQRAELSRRLADHDQNPAQVVPWADVKASLRTNRPAPK